MIAIKARFDGKVIVPDEPVNLPTDRALLVRIEPLTAASDSVLGWLADNAVDSAACPPDLADEHDHYLYGTPKRKNGS